MKKLVLGYHFFACRPSTHDFLFLKTHHPLIMHWSDSGVILLQDFFHRPASLLGVSDYSTHETDIRISILGSQMMTLSESAKQDENMGLTKWLYSTHHKNFDIHFFYQICMCKQQNAFHNYDPFRLHVDDHICPTVSCKIIGGY